MQSFVFLVGKADPHGAVVRAVRDMGYRVGLFHDTSFALNYPERYDKVIPIDFSQLDQKLEMLDLDSTTIVGLVCIYENYVVAKAILGARLHLPAATVESAQKSTDKYLMRQAFLAADPQITPRFAQVSSKQALLAFAATTTYPLVLKPTNLVKSLLVLRCDNEQELLKNFTYAQGMIEQLYKKYRIYNRSPRLIVEEFITGKSCSIAAFVDSHGTPHFCDGIVALTIAQEHSVNDTYLYSRRLPASYTPALTKKLFVTAKTGIRALGMRSTPAHIELIHNSEEIKIIEIGARIGGYRPRMYGASYNLNLIEQEVRLAVGQIPRLDGKFATYSAVFELFPERIGAFRGIKGLDDTPPYHYLSVKPTPGQIIGPAKNGYKAAVVIMIVHEDERQFWEVYQTVDTLKVEVIP